MDVIITIICAVIVLGVLVFIHEGGHYLTSRLFGVRVTEFMLGLPGPSVGFTRGETRFGVTAIPLGGYARVCGMEPGPMEPYLKEVLAALYRRGTATMEDIAADCGITPDEAYKALEELVEWGSACPPLRSDQFNTYRTPAYAPTRKILRQACYSGIPAPQPLAMGEPRPVNDEQSLFDTEYHQQYRSLPFWKRSVILLSGIVINLLFAIVAFIIIYSLIGLDVTNPANGMVVHIQVDPLQAIQAGFTYIGMVFQLVLGLFNPATAGDVVSSSTSIVGIAVMSKAYFAAGFTDALFFMAAISVSLGVMNLLPIPPLDGGRFLIEIIQKVTHKMVSAKAMNMLSVAGMILFLGFFVIMLNQDIQRLITGFWS